MHNEHLGLKVKFTYHDLEGKLSVENLWAEKEDELYRIKNVPFFAPNIAYNDLVSVEDDGGELYFDELIEPPGHSTIQIIFFDLANIKEVTETLVKFKCGWEGSHIEKYISVDVPKDVVYKEVKEYLDGQSKLGVLDYKEACLAH